MHTINPRNSYYYYPFANVLPAGYKAAQLLDLRYSYYNYTHGSAPIVAFFLSV